MSRAVVFQSIVADSQLQALGFDAAHVLPNFDGEQRPAIEINSSQFMFMVIRWQNQEIDPRFYRGPRRFDIWVHAAREVTTDFTHIDDVIEILTSLLTGIVDTAGGDGRSVTTIELEGLGADEQDSVYETICRNVTYKMISRVTATGEV